MSPMRSDRIELYHAKLIDFEHYLEVNRPRRTEKVESTIWVNFSFQAQTNISEKCNISWPDSSTKVVYIELRVQEDRYGVGKDNDSFEVREIMGPFRVTSK